MTPDGDDIHDLVRAVESAWASVVGIAPFDRLASMEFGSSSHYSLVDGEHTPSRSVDVLIVGSSALPMDPRSFAGYASRLKPGGSLLFIPGDNTRGPARRQWEQMAAGTDLELVHHGRALPGLEGAFRRVPIVHMRTRLLPGDYGELCTLSIIADPETRGWPEFLQSSGLRERSEFIEADPALSEDPGRRLAAGLAHARGSFVLLDASAGGVALDESLTLLSPLLGSEDANRPRCVFGQRVGTETNRRHIFREAPRIALCNRPAARLLYGAWPRDLRTDPLARAEAILGRKSAEILRVPVRVSTEVSANP